MTKLRNIRVTDTTNLRATKLNGIYRRPISFGALNELQELIKEHDPENISDEEGLKVIVDFALILFRDVFCDENGESFEDVTTAEDLNILPFDELFESVVEVVEEVKLNNTGKKQSPSRSSSKRGSQPKGSRTRKSTQSATRKRG